MKTIIILSAIYFWSGTLSCQESKLLMRTDKWRYEFSASAWNAGVIGDLTANKLPGYIHVSVSDKFHDPHFSLATEFEARKNTLLIIGQFDWISQTGSGTYAADTVYSNSILTVRPIFITGGVAVNFYTNSVVGFYLYGGARLNYVRTEIQTFLLTGGSQTEEESRGFIDPLAGLRFIYVPFKTGVMRKLYLKGYFDVGGFGIVSHLCFQSYAAAGYEINKYFDLRAGYRYLDVHYDTENYLFDAGFQGFQFTATTKF